MEWLFWAPLIAVSLHLFEEFAFPGHFPEWYVRYKPEIKKSVTKRFLITINVLLLILSYDVGALGSSKFGIVLWLGVTAMLAANGIWHFKGVVKTRSYSPGVLTGLLVYLPLAIYGYVIFLNSKQVSVFIALIALAIGASYQMWSNIYHRIRKRTTKS
jgi:hypothetical protein